MPGLPKRTGDAGGERGLAAAPDRDAADRYHGEAGAVRPEQAEIVEAAPAFVDAAVDAGQTPQRQSRAGTAPLAAETVFERAPRPGPAPGPGRSVPLKPPSAPHDARRTRPAGLARGLLAARHLEPERSLHVSGALCASRGDPGGRHQHGGPGGGDEETVPTPEPEARGGGHADDGHGAFRQRRDPRRAVFQRPPRAARSVPREDDAASRLGKRGPTGGSRPTRRGCSSRGPRRSRGVGARSKRSRHRDHGSRAWRVPGPANRHVRGSRCSCQHACTSCFSRGRYGRPGSSGWRKRHVRLMGSAARTSATAMPSGIRRAVSTPRRPRSPPGDRPRAPQPGRHSPARPTVRERRRSRAASRVAPAPPRRGSIRGPPPRVRPSAGPEGARGRPELPPRG